MEAINLAQRTFITNDGETWPITISTVRWVTGLVADFAPAVIH